MLARLPIRRVARSSRRRLRGEVRGKSVFGIGGTYPGDHLLVTVLFCRDLFTRSDAERCAPLVNSFKETTGAFLEQEKIFAGA